VLKRNMANIEKLATFIAVYIYATVIGDEDLLINKQLAETIKIDNLRFDPESMREECRCLDPTKEPRLAKIGANFITQFQRFARPQEATQTAGPSVLSIAAGVKSA